LGRNLPRTTEPVLPNRNIRMNNIVIALTATVAVLSVGGYNSSDSNYPDSVSTSSADRLDNKFRPPVRGETKAEVEAQYSDPDQVSRDGENGESWVYVFGKDKILGNDKLFIPGYGLFARVRVLTIHFDRDGRVTGWKTAIIGFGK
jgi:hypothetical protein